MNSPIERLFLISIDGQYLLSPAPFSSNVLCQGFALRVPACDANFIATSHIHGNLLDSKARARDHVNGGVTAAFRARVKARGAFY